MGLSISDEPMEEEHISDATKTEEVSEEVLLDSLLVCSGYSKDLSFWSMEHGKCIKRLHTYRTILSLYDFNDFVFCGAIDGTLLGYDRWPIKNRELAEEAIYEDEELLKFQVDAHSHEITCMRSCSNFLVTAHSTLKIWDIEKMSEDGTPLLTPLHCFQQLDPKQKAQPGLKQAPIQSIKDLGDGKFAAGGENCIVRTYELEKFRSHKLGYPMPSGICSIEYVESTQMLYVLSSSELRGYDLRQRNVAFALNKTTPFRDDYALKATTMMFLRKSGELFLGEGTFRFGWNPRMRQIHVLDVRMINILKESILSGHSDDISDLVDVNYVDGKKKEDRQDTRFASCSHDGKIKVWRKSNEEELQDSEEKDGRFRAMVSMNEEEKKGLTSMCFYGKKQKRGLQYFVHLQDLEERIRFIQNSDGMRTFQLKVYPPVGTSKTVFHIPCLLLFS